MSQGQFHDILILALGSFCDEGIGLSVFLPTSIWATWGVRRQKKVTDVFASLAGKLKLFLLPAYSSEFNPGELVSNDRKNGGVERNIITGGDDLKQTVDRHLRSLQKKVGDGEITFSTRKRATPFCSVNIFIHGLVKNNLIPYRQLHRPDLSLAKASLAPGYVQASAASSKRIASA